MGGTIVGLRPMLPPPLAQSSWWTLPIDGRRLAALRIGVGLVLLLDVLMCYLPRVKDFFGTDSLSGPGAFTAQTAPLEMHRVWLESIASATGWQALLWIWAAAGFLLTVGILPRSAAMVAWFLSISVTRINPFLHNSGDQVRNILLFYLMLSPCGAAWSVHAWRRQLPKPVLVSPWPVRLLLIQLALIYFMNGLFKLRGEHWHTGQTLGILLGDAAWMRFSMAGWPMPSWLLGAMTVTVLVWELSFPLLLLRPRLRLLGLGMGVAFHIGTALTMKLGPFPLYMLCLYLPLILWESFAVRKGPDL